MAVADLEEPQPEEPDTDGGHADDGTEEEEQDDNQEDDVVDGVDLGGLDEYPVHGIDDVHVTKYVATM